MAGKLLQQYKQSDVREGYVVQVYNQDRQEFSNAKHIYNALYIEHNGIERCLLFTDRELLLNDVKDCNSAYKLGHIYRFETGKKVYYMMSFIFAKDETKTVHTVRLSLTQMTTIVKRSENNLEDLPKKSLWVDLMD